MHSQLERKNAIMKMLKVRTSCVQIFKNNESMLQYFLLIFLYVSKGICQWLKCFHFRYNETNRMQAEFLQRFYELELPEVGVIYPANSQTKSDLKLLLEIATCSRLKQGQDKKQQHIQTFYCRSMGKDCFKIDVDFSKAGFFVVKDNYHEMEHKQKCDSQGESPNVIKIYNLMMLKKGLIEEFIINNNLLNASPQTILQHISPEGEYFYHEKVSEPESRRKLKKRFDNIINISIKMKREDKVKVYEQNPMVTSKKEVKPARKNWGSKKKLKENEVPKQRIKNQEQLFIDEVWDDRPLKKVKRSVENLSFSHIDKFGDERSFHGFDENFDMDNIFEQAGSNFWPESENSIGNAIDFGDKIRMTDLLVSIRNSMLNKSLEKRSLKEIEPNIIDPTD